MNSIHAILIVIIRLWAASSLLTAISSIAAILVSIFQRATYSEFDSQAEVYFIASYGTSLFWMIAGAVAWIAAPWIARKIYKVEEERIQLSVSAETLAAIGGFLIGGFILTVYLPQLFMDISWWIFYLAVEQPAIENDVPMVRPRYLLEWRSTISNLLTVLIGAWMALRPSYIARIFSWLRHAGQYEEKE